MKLVRVKSLLFMLSGILLLDQSVMSGFSFVVYYILGSASRVQTFWNHCAFWLLSRVWTLLCIHKGFFSLHLLISYLCDLRVIPYSAANLSNFFEFTQDAI